MKIILEPLSFEWDVGDISKNSTKHGVSCQEAEEVFINQPLIVVVDDKHSGSEKRFHVLGRSSNNRFLFSSITIRNQKIRIISIRDMNQKEKKYMKNIKDMPKFKNEAKERDFWNKNDSTEYVDWSKADQAIFPNLKLTTESISLRLPSSLLLRIKQLANERDVPYQSLMKIFLSDRVKKELVR